LIELKKENKELINNPILFIDISPNAHTNYKLIINKYIVQLMEKNIEDNLGLLELLILNNIHHIPIVIIVNGLPKYYINNDIKIIKNDTAPKYLTSSNICIGIDIGYEFKYPNIIESIYYK